MLRRLMICGSLVLMFHTLNAQGFKADFQNLFTAEFNWNGWLNAPDSVKPDWFSRGANVYFMLDFPITDSSLSFGGGVGVSTHNVYHNSLFLLQDSLGTIMAPIADSITFKLNKLATTYVEVPLELRFRFRVPNMPHQFKVGIGFRGGYLLSSHVKYSGEGAAYGGLGEVKYKLFRVPNMDNIRYGVTARIGFGPFNIIGFYGLSTLFESGKGPGLVPVSIGISLNNL